MKTTLGVWGINAKRSRVPYLITGILVVCGIATTILTLIGLPVSGLPIGNYLFLLPICMAYFIPTLNMTKILNLGGTRMDIFRGFFLTYAAAVVATALVSLILYYSADTLIQTQEGPSLNLWDVFGFLAHGPVVGFFQMAAFFFLFACVVHTLALSQEHWYGWVAMVMIVAVISVFSSIPVLRKALVWFFDLIIFNPQPAVQILACLVLGAAVYAASLVPIASKPI